jgi:DNA-binding response OmpR family regulator
MSAPHSLRLLVVEDDQRMLELLRKGLWEHGHLVLGASTGVEALQLGQEHDFDVILLDIGLPELDGYQVAARLRAAGRRSPILMLTAMDMEDDIIRGLDLGADDYMAKPFSFPELLARITALARRAGKGICEEPGLGGLTLDTTQRRVFYSGRQISLTRSEFLLLHQLMQHAGRPLSREELTENLWGKTETKRGVLDTLVNSLRSKLGAMCCRSLIKTVHGFGYCLQYGPKMMEEQNTP